MFHQLAIPLAEAAPIAMLKLSELDVIKASVIAFGSGREIEAERAARSSAEFGG
jgi:hypothetical protein